jgi:hypothetical protein
VAPTIARGLVRARAASRSASEAASWRLGKRPPNGGGLPNTLRAQSTVASARQAARATATGSEAGTGLQP